MINFANTGEQFPAGAYTSSLEKLIEMIEVEEDPHSRNDLIEELEVLMDIGDLQKNVSRDLLTRAEDITGERTNMVGSGKVGYAKFPVVENSTGRISILFIHVEESDRIRFEYRAKSYTSIYNSIEHILNKLQLEIEKFLVVNWGISINIEESTEENRLIIKGENDSLINGRSMEFAAAVSLISFYIGIEVPYNYCFTGAINGNGKTERVESINEKLKFILTEQPEIEKIFVPNENIIDIDNVYTDKVVGIETSDELIKKVFGKEFNLIAAAAEAKIKSSAETKGIIHLRDAGEKEIELVKDTTFGSDVCCPIEMRKEIMRILHLEFAPANANYTYFPAIDSLKKRMGGGYDLIVLNGKIPNFFTGYISLAKRQANYYLGVRIGSDDDSAIVIIFGSPVDKLKSLVGYKFKFSELLK